MHFRDKGTTKEKEPEDLHVEYYTGEESTASSSSDSLAPAAKSKNFEFTNNLSVMRLIRMFLCIEALGIAVDTPSVYMPVIFKICCRNILFYSIRFYSRPIIDLVYLLQYFLDRLIALFDFLSSRAQNGVEVNTARKLASHTFDLEINFIQAHNWHSISLFAHYFLGLFFSVLFVAFTLKMWQIKDWTDRNEVRDWLNRYIADGWWRRGGLMVAVNTAYIACITLFVVYSIFALAMQLNVNSIPEKRMAGSAVAVVIFTVVVVWAFGYMGIRATEVAFIRYVSQNVSYTSSMVLKKAVKAKVEVGFALMFIVFSPVLYNLMSALILVTDWNDNWNQRFRHGVNFYSSCYFMAFEPYVRLEAPGSCPTETLLSATSPQRELLPFKSFNILQCDSYLGIYLYTLSFVSFFFVLFGYLFLFHGFISTCISEILMSKWVTPLNALQSLRKIEMAQYKAKFSFTQRLRIGAVQELIWQWNEFKKSVASIWPFLVQLFSVVFFIVTLPMKILFAPLNFLGGRLFTLGCDGLTLEGRKRKYRAIQLKKLDASRTYRNRRYTIGMVYDVRKEEAEIRAAEKEFRSTKEMAVDFLFSGAASLYSIVSRCISAKDSLKRRLMTSEFVTSTRAQIHFFMGSLGGMRKHKIKEHHSHAPWRLATKVHSKTRMIQEIDRHILSEIERIKHEFVTDHALTITVFDTVMDTAGLTMLISPFRWSRLRWMLVVLVEMAAYSIIGAIGNFYVDWQTKLVLILLVNAFAGVITYAFMPYTELLDRSLDFMGRIFVAGTIVGILVVFSTLPPSIKNGPPEDIPLFKPWETFKLIAEHNPFQAGLFLLVDAVIAIYFYFYIINILNLVGLFRTIQRKFRSMVYSFHDHILDVLVVKLDERTIGLENVCSGLRLVQQWDDIIDEQRRYALALWPDVRPAWQLTAMQKLIEVKWAAAFNLSIGNLRSSLGLTLLHTVLCSGDCESARWLIHRYPDLLTVEDMQRDTPLAIALKECSFFVMKYSEQNHGALFDGSAFGDDVFSDYYPEIDEYRDENAEVGEFFPMEADVYNLRSIEMEQFIRHGYFDEVKGTRADVMPSFYEKKMKEKAEADLARAKASLGDRGSVNGAKSVVSLDNSSVAMAREKMKVQAARKNAAQERMLLASARFPEDECENDLESGQMDSWKIIGLEVPEVNIYIDDHEDANPILAEDFGEDVAMDKRVNIESASKQVFQVHDVAEVPVDHPERQNFQDWHMIGNKKLARQRSKLGVVSDNIEASLGAGGMLSAGMSMIARSRLQETLDQEARLREVRWRLCKYTELFLSKELRNNCQLIEWDVHLYKEWNKLASSLQGRIAQNLAMVCNFDPPEGFARISEWTQGVTESEFDEPDLHPDNIGVAEKGVLSMVKAYSRATDAISRTVGAIGKTLKRLRTRPGGGSTAGTTAHGAFNDRVIHFLAEAMVSSRTRLNLEDCELSVYGRFGWRAIIRAMRRKYCSFILPSTFVSAKRVMIVHLELAKNELDCGDAVLVADALLYQQTVKYLDLSFNRIGARGMRRLCTALKTHESICTVKVDHNRIGPGAGKEIGTLLKQSKTLRVLNLSHNRMGALVKYTQMFVREKLPSADHQIWMGVRLNRYLQILDLSYNHFGPQCARPIPGAINRHPSLVSLNISGNDIGAEKGAALLFSLAGDPGGEKKMMERINYYATIKERELRGENVQADIKAQLKEASIILNKHKGSKVTTRRKAITMVKPTKQLLKIVDTSVRRSELNKRRRPCQLAELCISDNQLGAMSGHGAAALLSKNKGLTALDLSKNSLGPAGGAALSAMLEKIYGLPPRDLHTEATRKVEAEQRQTDKKKKIIYSTLTSLDTSRNGLGSHVVGSLMLCLANKNCTITSLDVSHNPLGVCGAMAAKSDIMAHELRNGLSACKTLVKLNLAKTMFLPTQLVTMLGGLANNKLLKDLSLEGTYLDEPSCLQLAHVIDQCHQIDKLNLRDCGMGPQGSYLVLHRISSSVQRFTYLDLTNNRLGPRASLCIGKVLRDAECKISRLYVGNNDLTEVGGAAVAQGLLHNTSIREVDISNNGLTPYVGSILVAVAKGNFKHGRMVSHCLITNINVSDNPFGQRVGKDLVHAISLGKFKRIELANIGIGPSSAEVIGKALRDVCTTWRYCDFSNNNFGRQGMNRVSWSLRVNRSVRVFICRDNKAGPAFGTEDDALLKHGVSLPRMLRANVVMRELDLSFNGMSPAAGILLFEAMLDNYSIRRLSARGNLFNDDIAPALGDFIRFNDVVEDLDLGDNRLGYDCCFVLANGLEMNRALKYVTMDNNRLGNAAVTSIEALSRALMVNHSLRQLNLDGNKIGPAGGLKLAEALCRNNTLTRVSLRDNRLDGLSGKALLNAYEHNVSLMELGLTADEVGIDIWDMFSVIFNKKRSTISPDDLTLDSLVGEDIAHIINTYI